jgi:hypothetical protein
MRFLLMARPRTGPRPIEQAGVGEHKRTRDTPPGAAVVLVPGGYRQMVLQPVGPLPATIYWRRRAAAIVATVLVLVLAVWLVVSLTGGSGPGPAAQQSALSSSTTDPTTSTTAPTTPTPTTTTPTPTTTTSAATTTTQAPVPAPTTAPAAPVAPAPAPATPAACPDAAVGLTAQVAAPSYAVGEQPVFRILITNTSAAACTRDLDAGLQQVLVYSADGATRLWSSNDCFPGKSVDVPVLNPGEVKTYSVKWSGTTSEPTCQADRTVVPAGSYTVVVTLGGLSSPPLPFTIT